MRRSDLIHILQERNPHLHPSNVDAAVKGILDHLAETLAAGGRIEIRGFGSFMLRQQQPRLTRNPLTGEPVQLGEHYRLHFKPGLALRDRLNAPR
jgi:integration host factor subunit beta